MVTSTEILAQQIEALRSRLNGLSRTPQLPNSSVDNGSITVVSNGQPTAYVGVQYDGTSGAVVVAGPIPPYPNPPTLSTAIGGVKVHWDGSMAAPQTGYTSPVVAPLDFAAVDIHVSADPTFSDDNVGFGTGRGSFTSASGGDHFVSWPVSGQQVYARLVTRTKAGKFSPPSQSAGPVPSGLVQLGDIGFPIAQYAGGSKIYFTVSPVVPTAPAWGFTAGDMWLEQTGTATGIGGGPPAGTPLYLTSQWTGSVWVLLQDQGISTSLATAIIAQQTADGKATVFTQTTAPTWSGAAGTAYWINTSPAGGGVTEVWDGTTFQPYQLGNGAISPNSLVASNVIATGTIVAALMEARMVLATTVIAGDPNGTHASMQPDGFHVYDSNANEVIRLGTSSNDYFGVVSSTGQLVASVDQTGQGNFTGLNVNTDPSFQGIPLSQSLAASRGGVMVASSFNAGLSIAGITTRFGLGEISFIQDNTRSYWISVQYGHIWTNVGGTRALMTLHVTTDGTAPTTTSTIFDAQYFTMPNGSSYVYTPPAFSTYGNFSSVANGAKIRILACIEAFDGGGNVSLAGVVGAGVPRPYRMWAADAGPNIPDTYVANTGGGGVTSVTTYDTGALSPSGFWRYNGAGTLRTDTTDIVQGWDPSGFNGDGDGGWNFVIPNISGSVNWVQFYFYNNFSYFNSGGQALITLVTDSATGTPSILASQWNPGVTYPKPGGVTVTLPGSWNSAFTGRTVVGLYLGKAGTTNELYYIRGDGPSARLRINYTQ